MDERPFPHRPLPQPPPSRRGFMVVGGLAVVSAATGVWFGLHHDDGEAALPDVVDTHDLVAAATDEQLLIAAIDAASKHARGGARRARLAAIRADHVAHHAAIRAATADALYPQPLPKERPVALTGPLPKYADLRAREQRAAHAASTRAAALTGRSAALLASIAASEAIHAELLR